jgi:hypothetical protein
VDDLRSTLETARSIGFGGLLGIGIGALIYFYVDPNPPFNTLNPYVVLGISGVLGIGCQHAVERVLGFLFQPIFSYVRFRLKLLEIDQLLRSGRISEEAAKQLIVKLCEKRLLE